MFEEVSFMASFEGREGRCCDRKWKEENSWSVKPRSKRHDHHAVFWRWGWEKFYHLKNNAEGAVPVMIWLQKQAISYLILFYGEPVQLLEKRFGMFCSEI